MKKSNIAIGILVSSILVLNIWIYICGTANEAKADHVRVTDVASYVSTMHIPEMIDDELVGQILDIIDGRYNITSSNYEDLGPKYAMVVEVFDTQSWDTLSVDRQMCMRDDYMSLNNYTDSRSMLRAYFSCL